MARLAPRRQTWQERCRNVREYHIAMKRSESAWTIKDSALALGRSFGSIQEDLMLADMMRSHPKLESIKNLKDAVTAARLIKSKLELQ